MDIFSLILILKIILAIVFVGGLIFLFLASCSVYANLTTGVPWARISQKNIEAIFKEVELPKNFLIYDLGCGDGRVLFAAEKLGYRAIGYELSLYPYLKARFKKFIHRSAVALKRQDFFKQDLSQAEAVFIFLVGKVMDRLGRKLEKELKRGAVVISYGFTIPGWQAKKTIATQPSLAYVYKV
jgi:SAM-dependent methyltransferase